MKKIAAIGAIFLIAGVAFANPYNCKLQSVSGVSGFESNAAAQSWSPPVVPLKTDGSTLQFNYFDQEQVMPNAANGNRFEGRSEFFVSGMRVKIKAVFEPAAGQLRIISDFVAGGRKNATSTGYYNCTS